MGCSPPSSSVHGIFQARILEWVVMPSFRGSSWPRDQTCISCIGTQVLYHWDSREVQTGVLLLLLLSRFSRVRLCATPWASAHQAPLSMGFSRQEYWSGLPLPSLPDRCKGLLSSHYILRQWFSKCLHNGSISITWELVRNANFQAASKTYWIRSCYSKPLNNSDS